jgi:hypothetical protein
MTDAANCTGPWTTPLAVTAQSADEVPYLSQVSACTTQAGTETALINQSDIVWALFTTSGGIPVVHSQATFQGAIFRASIPTGHIAVMEPGSSVSIGAAPADTSWYADVALTTMWRSESTLIDAGVEQATDQIKAVLPTVFAPTSERGRAWITCGLAVYDTADATMKQYQNVQDGLDSQDLSDLVKATQDLGQSNTECQEGLQAADEADLRAARIKAGTISVADEAAHEASFAATAREELHWASLLRSALRLHL